MFKLCIRWGATAFSAMFLLMSLAGCKDRGETPATPTPAEELARARELLSTYDFGDRFREGCAILEALPKEKGADKDIAMDAFLLRAEVLLDLFVAARVTGDATLAETLEVVTGWELEGDLSRPRNFQILAQETQEIFALVHRELGDGDPRGARAAAMAGFAHDLQALIFVKREQLIATLERLEAAPDGPDASRAAAVALGELLRPASRSWRDHVLSTLGIPCPAAVGGLMAALCVPDPEGEVRGQCLLEGVKHPAGRRVAAAAALMEHCDALGDVAAEGQPMAGIRAWYVSRLATLQAADAPLAAWLREHRLETWTAGLDAALAPAFALLQSD